MKPPRHIATIRFDSADHYQLLKLAAHLSKKTIGEFLRENARNLVLEHKDRILKELGIQEEGK